MIAKPPINAKFNAHARENAQAKQLAEELESVSGAQRLGDGAFETAKEDQTKPKAPKP